MNYLDILQDREVMAILTQIDIFNQTQLKYPLPALYYMLSK